MNASLKTWIAQELNRRNWSYRELARQAGISHTLISRILSCDINPSVNFFNRVAQFLDVPRLAALLPPTSPATPADDSTLQELVELARNLPPAQRKQLLQYTRFLAQTGQDE